ncbi:hypothetical protein [Thermicanus aegyptius]|nr:hypothetical protein [Thermicanus aegyptius]
MPLEKKGMEITNTRMNMNCRLSKSRRPDLPHPAAEEKGKTLVA